MQSTVMLSFTDEKSFTFIKRFTTPQMLEAYVKKLITDGYSYCINTKDQTPKYFSLIWGEIDGPEETYKL